MLNPSPCVFFLSVWPHPGTLSVSPTYVAVNIPASEKPVRYDVYQEVAPRDYHFRLSVDSANVGEEVHIRIRVTPNSTVKLYLRAIDESTNLGSPLSAPLVIRVPPVPTGNFVDMWVYVCTCLYDCLHTKERIK